jgi:hypothetical protein
MPLADRIRELSALFAERELTTAEKHEHLDTSRFYVGRALWVVTTV